MREHLWRTPFDSAKQHALSDEMVRDAEQRLGVKLPAAYIDILKVQNGGYLRYDTYPSPVPTSWSRDHIGVDHIMGIGPGEAGDILATPYLVEEWEMPKGIVLLSGDGHTWVALDYRTCGPTGEPSVTWFDNEMEEEVALAPNFQTFVDGLVDGDHRHIFGFVGVGETADQLLAGLGQAFNTSFTSSTPFPSFSGPLSAWNRYMDRERDLWVYPNKDAAGDDHYPDHPECDWLLACEIRRDEAERVAALIAEHVPYPAVLLHRPPWLLEYELR